MSVHLENAYNRLTELYFTVQANPEVQQRVTTATRTIVGIYSTAQFPGTAITGALTSSIAPEKVKYVTDTMEGAVTALWRKLSFNQKIALSTAGIACVSFCDPSKVFTVLGTAFAFKLGAELAYRNKAKEERITAEIKATESLPDPDEL